MKRRSFLQILGLAPASLALPKPLFAGPRCDAARIESGEHIEDEDLILRRGVVMNDRVCVRRCQITLADDFASDYVFRIPGSYSMQDAMQYCYIDCRNLPDVSCYQYGPMSWNSGLGAERAFRDYSPTKWEPLA